jgi:hypothetical protein
MGGETSCVCIRFPPSVCEGGLHTQSAVFLFYYYLKSYRRFFSSLFSSSTACPLTTRFSPMPNLVPCHIGTIAAAPVSLSRLTSSFVCVLCVLGEPSKSADFFFSRSLNRRRRCIIFVVVI